MNHISTSFLLLFSLACAPRESVPEPNSSQISEPEPAKKSTERPTQAKKTPASPTVIVYGQDKQPIPIQVELALTEAQRAQGLMFRERLDEGHGMLFVMDRIANHRFWMKNTPLSLDILFIASDGELVGVVEEAEPETLTGREVGRPSKYVLELRGGTCKKRGIKPGSWVNLSGAIPQ